MKKNMKSKPAECSDQKRPHRIAFLLLFLLFSFVVICFIASSHVFPLEYRNLVISCANKFNVDPLLVAALIYVESSYKENSISKAGAMGLMQVMPPTGRETAKKLKIKNYANKNLLVPEINTRIGTAYLARLINKYDGNTNKALAAYNAGTSNIKRWIDKNGNLSLKKVDFKETKSYIRKTKFFHKLLKLTTFVTGEYKEKQTEK